MSEPELVNSASEDENNETEESKISDDEYLPDFTKLQLYMHGTKPVFQETGPRNSSI